MKKGWILLLLSCLLGLCMGAQAEESPLGTWHFVGTMEYGEFEDMRHDPQDWHLVFSKDGSFASVVSGNADRGSWQMKDNLITYQFSPDGKVYTALIMENGLLLDGDYLDGQVYSLDGEVPAFETVEPGVTADGFYYEQLPDGFLMITGHESNEERAQYDDNGKILNPVELVIPAEINGVRVTTVGKLAFYGNRRLQSAVLSEGIIYLAREAFNECSSLRSVSLPESLLAMGAFAFSDCDGLSQIALPESLYAIQNNPFDSCSGLSAFTVQENHGWFHLDGGALIESAAGKLIAFPCGNEASSYTIPDYVTEIGVAAFGECENLQQVKLHDRVTKISSRAFERSGITEIFLPLSLDRMGSNPFENCRQLQKVEVAEGHAQYYTVDGVLFEKETHALIYYPLGKGDQAYTIPEGTKIIGDSAFARVPSLEEVVIPGSVETIDHYAFYGMENLKTVVIPDSVTMLGAYVFCECRALESVEIPSSVPMILYCTFGYCKDLQVSLPEGITIEEGAFENAENITLIHRQ